MRAGTPLPVIAAALLCLPVLRAEAKPAPQAIADSTIEIRCDDSLTVLPGRRIEFPRPVAAAAYDSSGRTLFADCYVVQEAAGTPGSLTKPVEIREQSLIAYSLDTRRVTWTKTGEWLPARVVAGRLLAVHDGSLHLLDPTTGEELRHWPAADVLLGGEGAFIVREGDELVRVDPHTATDLWRRRLEIASRASFVVSLRDTLVVTGDGIAVLRLQDGAGWEYAAATRRSDVVSRIATNVITMAAGLAVLDLVIPEYWGTRLDDLGSTPLLAGDRVYFGADTLVVSLHRDNGMPLWTRRLGQDSFDPIRLRGSVGTYHPPEAELPGHLLLGRGGGSLAVLTLGYAPNGRRTWRADPPSIALLDPETGKTRVRTRIRDTRFARGYRHVPGGHLVMTPKQIVLYDDALATRGSLALPAGAWSFESFELDPARLLVRTNAGLAAIDPDSLSVKWERHIGGGLERAAAAGADGRMWWIGHSGLLAIPAVAPRPPLGASLRSARGYIDHGVAIATDGRVVTLLALPGARIE